MASRVNKSVESEGTPQVQLYPYQKEWITDAERFKLMVKSRQTGLSFATTFRHCRRRIAKRGTTVWASASQRQSNEAGEYAKLHFRALRELFDYEEIEFPDYDEKAIQITLYRGMSNEARLVFLPANPDTLRGYSGDVVLDEFGFHRKPKAIWKASLAIASRGFDVEVISTPNEQQGQYWEICKGAGVPPDGLPEGHPHRWMQNGWSVHHLDIYEAVRQGCPIDIDAMKRAVDDEDAWAQEYCCQFLADAQNYISMELIVLCESEDASLEMPIEQLRGRRNLYLGADIGRKKDRTVIWVDELVGDVLVTRRVDVLDRVPFAKQFQQIDSLMPFMQRGCIDATGIGAQIAEDLVKKYGSKVEAVEFNIANKEAMATATKTRFENRTRRIPGAPFIRRSINAVKRFTSPTGHFRFDAERTDKGHADEFWAMALAGAAASGPATSTEFVASRVRQAHSQTGAYA